MTRLFIFCSFIFLASCGGSGSSDNEDSSISGRWFIPVNEIIDAGPGKNGIPSLNYPKFKPSSEVNLDPNQLILGVRHNGITKAYPHNILDWHEVVNDRYENNTLVLSYCPLTGSGMLWKSGSTDNNPIWGVSGLLYNSNLILFDQETDSNWSQMLEQSVNGAREAETPVKMKVVEMSWGAWKQMYPDSIVLSESTGFDRDYSEYPYRTFRTNESLLFPVSNQDNRLHPKTRVVGIRADKNISKVFPIYLFSNDIEVINTDFNEKPIVVIGGGGTRFAAIYSAKTSDDITHTFTAIQGQLPIIMSDEEGNNWDIFGRAVSGDRVGQELDKTNSFIAYWYAWAAFYPDAEIYF